MGFSKVGQCKGAITLLTLRGQPDSPKSMTVRKQLDKSYYCGPSMECTKDELNNFERDMGLPISTVEMLAPLNRTSYGNSDGPDGYNMDTITSLPGFNDMMNV